MDSKINTEPNELSAKEMDEDESLGFIDMIGFGIIASVAMMYEWIIQAFGELPEWARENFGLLMFFSVSGAVVLPEMKYLWIALFGIPFGLSVFAAGFLAVVEQADPRGDMFENDSSMWLRRAIFLALPTSILMAIIAIR